MTRLVRIIRNATWAAAALAAAMLAPQSAFAHGERAQEPYLRTRTVQFYDVKFDHTQVKVNDIITVTGKFHLMGDWPDAVSPPDVVFLATGSPGPMVVRLESYVNGIPARQSFSKLEIGQDYDFKQVLKARVPGRFHIHPLVSIKGSGALVGPGEWLDISGSAADFTDSFTTLTGNPIEDLETYKVGRAIGWYLVWIVLAAAWLLYWLLRPLLIPRAIALSKGREDLLVTSRDLAVGLGVGVAVIFLTAGGYAMASAEYPYNVPLQSGTQRVDPLPLDDRANIVIKVLHATYDVPGRSMKITARMTNNGNVPLTLGELTTANIRFVNKALPAAVANVDPAYPKELVARTSLNVKDASPLQPGETRDIDISATDAMWETERLTSFLTDVDSKFGALLFFYTPDGKRRISEIGGAILPVFTEL